MNDFKKVAIVYFYPTHLFKGLFIMPFCSNNTYNIWCNNDYVNIVRLVECFSSLKLKTNSLYAYRVINIIIYNIIYYHIPNIIVPILVRYLYLET